MYRLAGRSILSQKRFLKCVPVEQHMFLGAVRLPKAVRDDEGMESPTCACEVQTIGWIDHLVDDVLDKLYG